jgi:hypothetical protein
MAFPQLTVRCDTPSHAELAAWPHATALRLFPDSPYAKNHTSPVVGICKTNYPHVVSVLSYKMSQAKAPHRKMVGRRY